MAGPFAAQRLGDLGADVIKVEPTTGEWQRYAAAGGAHGNEINVSFLSLNRNKRSLAVDLKNADGKRGAARARRQRRRLPAELPPRRRRAPRRRLRVPARDQPVDRLRLDLGLRRRRPLPRSARVRTCCCRPCRARCCRRAATATPPTPAGQYLADAVTASTAFEAVLAALLHRERTGEGQLVTVNMLDALTTLQMQELSVFTVGGMTQERSAEPHAHVYIRAPVRRLRDDATATSRSPSPTCTNSVDSSASRRSRAGTARSRGGPVATRSTPRRRRSCARQPRGHWLETLGAAGMWIGPGATATQELVDDPQIVHNGTFIEYDHPTEGLVKTPGLPVPLLARPPHALPRRPARRGAHARDPRRGRARRRAHRGPARRRARSPSLDRTRGGVMAATAASRGTIRAVGSRSSARRPTRAGDGPLIDWDAQPLEGFESAPDRRARAALRPDRARPSAPRRRDRDAAPAAARRRCSPPTRSQTWPRRGRAERCDSYTLGGRLWALPLDAATQVVRPAAARRVPSRRRRLGRGRSRSRPTTRSRLRSPARTRS